MSQFMVEVNTGCIDFVFEIVTSMNLLIFFSKFCSEKSLTFCDIKQTKNMNCLQPDQTDPQLFIKNFLTKISLLNVQLAFQVFIPSSFFHCCNVYKTHFFHLLLYYLGHMVKAIPSLLSLWPIISTTKNTNDQGLSDLLSYLALP